MSESLKDRVAVISGGSHGLGKAIASHLASMGAHVVLLARNIEPLQVVAAEIADEGGQVTTISCNVSDSGQVRSAASKIMNELGRVDILINNAGIPAPRTFQDTSIDDWDSVVGVNLSGVFYLTRALWDGLTDGGGYVITISGTAGLRGGGSPAYGSTKFGLTGLNHSIAVAGKEHNVRATILYPGGMDTGWRGAPIGEKPPEESMNPDEVARYIGYLITTPDAFVINEAVLNPINYPYM
jgi:NAD(P)-dependent dehydrogenase (short-subunit alcohol dehydrogenase family)